MMQETNVRLIEAAREWCRARGYTLAESPLSEMLIPIDTGDMIHVPVLLLATSDLSRG